MDSLTKVTRQDVDTAWENFERQKEKHSSMLEENIQKWHSTLKFNWWDRYVRKIDKMTAKELYVHELSGMYVFQQERWLEERGIWNDEFDWTIGCHGGKHRDIVRRLYKSKKPDHLVNSGTLSWIMDWRDKDV